MARKDPQERVDTQTSFEEVKRMIAKEADLSGMDKLSSYFQDKFKDRSFCDNLGKGLRKRRKVCRLTPDDIDARTPRSMQDSHLTAEDTLDLYRDPLITNFETLGEADEGILCLTENSWGKTFCVGFKEGVCEFDNTTNQQVVSKNIVRGDHLWSILSHCFKNGIYR